MSWGNTFKVDLYNTKKGYICLLIVVTMSDLTSLKRKRGIIKGNITRQNTFINSFDDSKVNELAARLSRVNEYWDEYESVQYAIEELENGEEQDEERNAFTKLFFEVVGKLNSLMPINNAATSSSSTQSSNVRVKTEVKLPPMEIPLFNGSYKQWLEFHDTFHAVVDSNTNLSDVEKFYYLKSVLKGNAADVIHSLEVSSTNYQEAWSLLKERYENKKIIALSHLDSMYNFPPMARESAPELRKFVDEIKRDLRALKTLGLGVDSWDVLLIYIFERKLDSLTRKEWQKQNATDFSADDFPTINVFLKFLTNKCSILETTNKVVQNSENKFGKINERAPRLKGDTLNSYGAFQNFCCVVCKSSEHYIQRCKQFQDMSLQDKRLVVNNNTLCWNCLRTGHRVQACTFSGCSYCKGKHHRLLHVERQENSREVEASQGGRENEDNNNRSFSFNGHSRNSEGIQIVNSKAKYQEVLLSTALVKIKDAEGHFQEGRALLDCGSQSSFITKEFRNKLGLTMRRTNISILGIGTGATNISQMTKGRIFSKVSEYSADIGLLVIDKISNDIPLTKVQLVNIDLPQGFQLADTNFNCPGKIDLLLGAPVFWDILGTNKFKLRENGLIMQETKLGYIVAGPINFDYENGDSVNSSSCHLVSKQAVQDQLEKFWVMEEISRDQPRSKEEEECESFFTKTTARHTDGKLVVRLPFRQNAVGLGNSVDNALKRFHSVERRMERDTAYKESYHKFIQEYIGLGHMTKLEGNFDIVGPNIYYLPHHAVLKTTSLTTKLRVVFDASSRSSNGVSLNNNLLVGPRLQDDIFAILLRFRMHKVVITADVEKMFRQIWVAEKDRDFQRILWRFDKDQPIEHYCLNTVTYGMSCSSYLAVKGLQQAAVLQEEVVKGSHEIILKDFYMDDLLTGAEDERRAKELKVEISRLLNELGFVLRKWGSNVPTVIEGNKEAEEIEHYISSGDSSTKTLGILWNSRADVLQFGYSGEAEMNRCMSKRQILSLVCRVFDPLGLIAPIIIGSKILLQDLWRKKLGWDDEVPEGIAGQWYRLEEELQKLSSLKIPRYVLCDNREEIQLHGFCDASLKAYGACVYVRSYDLEGNCKSNLVCSKSRVAPLKTVSLPRLELCGALLLSKLIESVVKSFRVAPSSIHYWTDSSIVLCWLAGEPSRWTTFVANRTAEIQTLTKGHSWHHVLSEDNPADLVSRGVDCNSLRNSSFWWTGPDWLSDSTDLWPQVDETSMDNIPEQRAIVVQGFLANTNAFCELLFSRFSSYNRLLRTVGYCLRFIKNCRIAREERTIGILTVDELNSAEKISMILVQSQAFHAEVISLRNGKPISQSSCIMSLNPFLDTEGILRVGGRLGNADIEFDQKYPVILPRRHRITKLLIMREHQNLLHAGPQALLAQVRLRYWPLGGRQTIRSVLRTCITCFRVKPFTCQQLMGDLPKSRLRPARPFANCGIDYAGPFNVKVSKIRGHVVVKAYLCVFICFVTKAVHLELVSDLTTHSFLNCFRRFVARRGLCSNVYSDNATNFKGADKELQDMYNFLKNKKTQDRFSEYFSQCGIKWHFIPPRSPHFGGLWESGVRMVKYHLKRVIGDQHLTFEELYTVITQVESCLNSRPITPLSESPDDLEILTPGHFLIGTSLRSLPQEDLNDQKISRLQRYHLLTQLIQSFWKRWTKEYLSQLQQRTKWRGERASVKVGDMVIVKDENLPPLKWQLGRVVEVHPGRDHRCRVVTIRTSSGTYKRGISRLCVLPLDTL